MNLADYLHTLQQQPDHHHRLVTTITHLITQDTALYEHLTHTHTHTTAPIDIEATTNTGDTWAIQIRHDPPDTTIHTRDIQPLINATPPDQYAGRILITTATTISPNAATTATNNQLTIHTYNDLNALHLDWHQLHHGTLTHTLTRHQLRDDQQPAVTDLLTALQPPQARTQLIRACGTGKTLIIERVTEQLGLPTNQPGNPLIVIAAPTIALINQTLAVYRTQLGNHMPPTFATCSDRTLNTGEAVDGETIHGVTSDTNPQRLADWITRHQHQSQLIISTHVSLPTVAAALNTTNRHADLLIIDEAHHYANASDTSRTILNPDAPFTRYLFATATPRRITGTHTDETGDTDDFTYTSMDNTDQFGTVAHTYTFQQAIDDNVLCDYQIVAAVITDTDIADTTTRHLHTHPDQPPLELTGDELVTHLAVIAATRDHQLTKLVAYNTTTSRSRRWTHNHRRITERLLPADQHPEVRHLDGTTNHHTRNRILNELADHSGPAPFILSNVRILNEGVDVTDIDAVIFNHPRNSVTDIVQIIGRALRRDPNRPDKIATVVVPIHHTDLDDDRQWQTVTNILRALRTFDATFTDQLNAATLHHHPNSSGASGLDKLVITGTHQLPDDLLDRIRTCIIDRASDPWLIRYRRVYDWTVTNGRTPNYSEPDGEWVSQQRTYYNAGRLADNRIAFMEQLPGWTWTPFEDSWQDQFGQVTAFFAEHGRLPTTAEPGGRWLSDQRSFKWTDRLRGDRHQVLDTALPPGWDQRKRADRWDTMFAAAEAFCQEHGHPPVYPYDTGELAIWVDDQKTLRRYPTSKSALSPERQQRLESLPGWTWDHPVDA